MPLDEEVLSPSDQEQVFGQLVLQVYRRQNLILTPLQQDDEALFIELFTNPEVTRYLDICCDHATAKQWFAHAIAQRCDKQMFYWVLRQDSDGKGFGLISLHRQTATSAELGVLIEPAYRFQGYGLQALGLIRAGFFSRRALNELRLRMAEGNQPAVSAARHTGFVVQQQGNFLYWTQTLAQWQAQQSANTEDVR